MFTLAALTLVPTVAAISMSGISLAWGVGSTIVGVIVTLWVYMKVSTVKFNNLKEEVNELKANQLQSEKEIGQSLRAIELQLKELTTIVRLFMESQGYE